MELSRAFDGAVHRGAHAQPTSHRWFTVRQGEVDVLDLLAVIGHWGLCPGADEGAPPPFPETIGECFGLCEEYYGPWEECMDRCIQGVCAEHPEQCE